MVSIFISIYRVSGKKPTTCFCRKFALCCPFELKIGQAIHVTLGKVVLNFQPISLNRIFKKLNFLILSKCRVCDTETWRDFKFRQNDIINTPFDSSWRAEQLLFR